jgi:hypothetical protein
MKRSVGGLAEAARPLVPSLGSAPLKLGIRILGDRWPPPRHPPCSPERDRRAESSEAWRLTVVIVGRANRASDSRTSRARGLGIARAIQTRRTSTAASARETSRPVATPPSPVPQPTSKSGCRRACDNAGSARFLRPDGAARVSVAIDSSAICSRWGLRWCLLRHLDGSFGLAPARRSLLNSMRRSSPPRHFPRPHSDRRDCSRRRSRRSCRRDPDGRCPRHTIRGERALPHSSLPRDQPIP